MAPYLSIWTVGIDCHKAFFLTYLGPPILEDIDHRLEKRWRIHKEARIDGTALRVQSDHETGDDSKVAASSPDTKEQIRVFVLTGGNHRAVCNNHRCLRTRLSHLYITVNVGGLLQQDYR